MYDVTRWLQQQKASGFLSEFGGGDNAHCLSVLNNTISYLENNSEWIGWAVWGAGPLLGPAYFENIEPGEGMLVERASRYAFVLIKGQAWSSIQPGSNFWSRASSLPTISNVSASPTRGVKRFLDDSKGVAEFDRLLNVCMKCKRGGYPVLKSDSKHSAHIDYIFFSVACLSNIEILHIVVQCFTA